MKRINNKHLFTVLAVVLISSLQCVALTPIMYKQIGTTKLFMEIYTPEKMDTARNYPAIIFFFGGGWNSGSVKQFEPQAKYFAQRGMVCFIADYRVKERQKATPFESLKDAKSAVRFIREHANEFNVDTGKIVVSGGSAGGHLAAATALIEDYNENSDDLSVSCIPNALVLFNPVIDNGPGGYGYNRIGAEFKNFSPLHNLRRGTPPTIFFLGTKDKLIPVETAKYYKKVMENLGSRCELKLYEGQGHSFFNYENFEYYTETVFEADQFLQSLGYIDAEPIIKIK